MDRVWVSRLRWRMRGAWLWPCFAVLTLVDAVLIDRLPFYDDGPNSIVGGLLIAGFANLFIVAVLAPLAGRPLRRRRRDLPRVVAADYAGTVLVALLAVGFLVAGLAHRPVLAAEHADEAAAVASSQQYVVHSAPAQYRSRLAQIDVLRLEEDKYRSCVPGPDPRRWLCLFVDTGQRPAGVTRDPAQVPNASYRVPGGFR